MIKYNLKCSNNHEFESWFAESSEFEKLNKQKLLECIYCHSKNIKKSIMAPMLSVEKKDKTLAIEAQKRAQKYLDRYASRNLLHKNKAARLKKRLNLMIKGMS